MTSTPQPAITLSGVTKTFDNPDGTTFNAVDDMSLTIGVGEVVAFLGPNGAGKTTTIDMILGLTRPTSGSVRVFDDHPRQATRRGRVAAVMQTGGLLPDLSVEDTVRMIGSLYPGSDTEHCIDRAGLTDFRTRKVSRCSGGQQQKLRFALALLSNPTLLILDEPTAGMDVEARREFWRAVREDAGRGRTIMFATHYLEEADQFADRIVLVAHGKVVADGTTAQIRSSVDGRVVSAVLPDRDVRALLGAVPGSRVQELRGNRTYFASDDSDELLRVMLSHTSAREIEVVSHNLEDAFIKLTRQATDLEVSA